MTRRILIAVAAAAALVSASPPEMDAVVAADPPPAGKQVPAPAPSVASAPRVVSSGGAYPPCSATVRDRCNQLRGSAGTRTVRAAPQRVRHRQLAMRAGERG